MERENSMGMVVVQLPRGRTVVIWFDPVVNSVKANHAGLIATLFTKGVKDWEGRLLLPSDGRVFLSAVYDYLFRHGYDVHWLHSVAGPGLISEQAK